MDLLESNNTFTPENNVLFIGHISFGFSFIFRKYKISVTKNKDIPKVTTVRKFLYHIAVGKKLTDSTVGKKLSLLYHYSPRYYV